MNEETNENNEQQAQGAEQQAEVAVSAASMLGSPSGGQAGDGQADRIAQLERELQQERVEKGRLRQTNDELRKAQEEIARLKAENAKLSTRRPDDYLSAEEREKIDADQLAVIDKVVQGRMGDASAAVKAENDRLREEMARRNASEAEMRKAQFDAEVERIAPGLVAAISDGHIGEWQKWRGERRRASSVNDAFATFDAATAADFIMEFAEAHGIRAQEDGVAARPQTSYSLRGGNRPPAKRGDANVYTVEQVSQALRAAASDYEAGRITIEERRAIQKKYDAAYAEGRVVER